MTSSAKFPKMIAHFLDITQTFTQSLLYMTYTLMLDYGHIFTVRLHLIQVLDGLRVTITDDRSVPCE